MGRQSRYEERESRFPLPWLRGRSTDVASLGDVSRTVSDRRTRLARYGMRALLVAGAAGAAWFLGTQAADAAPAHDSTAPVHADQRESGLLPATSRVIGSVAGTLTGSGGHCAAGDKTCGRPSAAPHGGTATPHAASVANSTRVAHQVTPGAVPAGSTAVPAGGVSSDTTGASPARRTTSGSNTSGVSVDPETSGQSRGLLADATGSLLVPVLDAARPVTGPLDTVTRPVAAGPSQGLPTVLTGVLRPVTSTVSAVAGPITGTLTGPLVTATRPVTGLLSDAVRPLPGACGVVVTPLTGVLTGATGPLSGTTAPTGSAPSLASGHPAGTHQAFPPSGLVSTVQHWAGTPSATWTEHAGTRIADRVIGTTVPFSPEPTPLAYPGSGISTGGMASSSSFHVGGGAFTPAASPVVRAGSASRVQPGTAVVGQPRLCEVDPVVTPD